MDLNDFDEWLHRYGAAWMKGDPEAAIELFSENACYYETPFDLPLVGQPAIHRYWTEGAKNSQSEVTFFAKPIFIQSNYGMAHWQATFKRVPSGAFVELDGILAAQFNEVQRCTEFREWWHRKETNK